MSTAEPVASTAAPATTALNTATASTATASTAPQLKTADNSPPAISGLASQVNVAENGNYQFWPTLTDAAATASSDSLSVSVTNGRLFFQRTNGLTFTSGTNDSSSMTVTGSLANLSAAASGLTYDPTIGVVGSDTLQVTLANSSDGLSGSAAVGINLVVPPSVGGPLRSTVTLTATTLNNTSYAFAAGAFNLWDINASGTSDSAQIFVASVNNGPGTVTLGSTAGVSVVNGSNGSSAITINGTLANLNAALNTLTYTPGAGFTGQSQVYVILHNSVNGLQASNAVTFDVIDPNGPSVTAPVSETLALNQSLAFTGANAVSVTDPGASGSSDSVRIALSFGTVSLGTTSGLTFTNGSNNSNLLTVTGTLANLNAALGTLTYTAQNSFAGPNPLYITATNSVDNLTSADIVLMTVAAPVVTAPASGSLNENSSLTFPGSSISVTDPGAIYYLDGFAYESVTLSAANGTLALGSTNGLLYSYGSNNSSVISVTGTLANVNAALSGLIYTPNAGFAGSDAIQISFKDWFDGLVASATVPLTVTSPPTIMAPANAWLWENTALVFTAGQIALNDAAATGTSDSLSLSVSDGILLLGSTSGLTFTSGAADTSSMTVTGTLANLNAALSGLAYEPTFYYSGPETLQLLVNDSNDNQSASTGVAINVAPAPVVYLSGAAHLSANSSFNFGSDISVADLGASSPPDTLSLSVSHGILNLGTTAGVSFVSGSSGASSMTISGTIANLNAALNGLVYTPTSGYVGSDDLSVDLVDWPHNRQCGGDVPITVTGAPPSIAAPATANLNENSAFNFASTISVTDSLASGSSDSLSLSVSNGVLTFSSTAGLTFGAGSNGSSSMTVNSTLDGLNSALRGLQYTPSAGFSGVDSLQLTLVNLTNHLTASAAVSLTVNPPPAVSAPATAIMPENGSYHFPGTITLTDPVAAGNSDVLDLWVVSGTLTLGNTNGITFVSGSNDSLEMMITGTLANLNSAVYGLTYTASAGVTGQEGIEFVLANGIDRMSGSAQVVLTIDAPPAVTAPSSLSIYQNIPYTFANAINVSDPPASGASDTVSLAVNHGTLNLGSTTGISVTAGYDGSSSISFSGTLANLNAALNGLVYSPSLPYYGNDSLTILVGNANDALTASASVPISIIGNDAPVITAPSAATVSENASYNFAATVSIADPYPLATTETLSLSALNGILTLGSTSGLTFRSGSGSNNSSGMTVIGSLANVNAALDGLVYTPTPGYTGTTQVGLVVTGTADNLTGLANVVFTVTSPVPPSVIAPPTAAVGENASFTFSGSISVVDPNATASSDSVTISAVHGKLTLLSTNGLSFSAGTNGSSSMTISGTLTNIDAALNGLVYAPNAGYSGSDSLQISIADAATGLSGSAAIALSISPPPKVTAPTSASLIENASYAFTNTISLADPGASGTSDSLSLSVAFGKLTLGSTTGLTFSAGSNNTSSVTVTGTLANLSAALTGLIYTPNSGFSGRDTLAVSLADSIDALTGSATVAIFVNPYVTAPATASVVENSQITFSATNRISVADGGASGTSDTITLTVSHGKLTLGSTTGLTFVSGANGSPSITIQGTLANLNAALSGLVYAPTPGYIGPDTLAVTLYDAGDGLSASASVAISVILRHLPGAVSFPPATAAAIPTTPNESDQWAGVSAAVQTLYE